MKRLMVTFVDKRPAEYVKADVYVTDGQLLHFHDIGGGKNLPVLTINQSVVDTVKEVDIKQADLKAIEILREETT